MSRERWRPVPGYRGRYEVSSAGRVRSLLAGRVVVGGKDDGYRHLDLFRDGRRLTRHVHVLVLEAFRGLRRAGQVSRHLNGRRGDNRLANLRWGSRAENEADKRRHRRSGHKLTAALARRIRRARGLQRQVAARFNVSPSLVSMIRSGKSWAGA